MAEKFSNINHVFFVFLKYTKIHISHTINIIYNIIDSAQNKIVILIVAQ